jgi:multiple sugar transport system substrate-binding protein
MKMEWENELKQDIPDLEQRININIEQVHAKINVLGSHKTMRFKWALSTAAAFVIVVGVLIQSSNVWHVKTSTDQQASEKAVSELSGSIKTTFRNDQDFIGNYGDLIRKHFPKLHVSFIDATKLEMNENYRASYDLMIDEQIPDLIVINGEQDYARYVQEGKLLNLTKYMNRDQVDLSDILPPSIQTLKEKGNGSIYGLAPAFNNRALLYNKALFDKYKITYPTDHMSWDDILNLAKQFPQSNKTVERIYGFHEMYMSMFTPVHLLYMMANTNGLKFMNSPATQVTMDTEAWNHVFHLTLESYQSGLLHTPATVVVKNNQVGQSDLKTMDLFSQGKAAMTLDSVEFYNRTQAKPLGFEVGVVTAPVNIAQPNAGSFFSTGPIYAIHSKAADPDTAWEVIKYINSEAVAKLKRQTNFGLTNHMSLLETMGYKDLDKFYSLDKSSSPLYDFPNLPKSDFNRNFDAIIEEEVKAVMDGKQDIDTAQKNIQQREQRNLDQAQPK